MHLTDAIPATAFVAESKKYLDLLNHAGSGTIYYCGITYITLCLANCSSRLSIKSFRKQRVPTMDVEQVILLKSQAG